MSLSQKISLALTCLLLQLCVFTNAQTLPHSTPEEQGVSSKDISAFLDAAGKSKTEFHSFMLLRHGKVIAEGWWNPYKPTLKHTLYSCSKSFTATAVGFAVNEKLVKLDDKVISFFPDQLPDTVSANLADLTVKDALMMSDGQRPDPTSVVGKDSNWVKAFLATPVLEDPGTTFLYNSLGTYMLSAIVQKVSGQTLIEYLKPRLFTPLGITGMDWESDTKGINTGGWGLRLKTEDMAKFAQLFLQKGIWNGKQVLPLGWAEEASTMKIMQDPSAPQSKKDSSDWLQGYCYQMWRCRNNAFRGDGAYGQYMIVMPEQDVALAITAETPDMQEEINLVWKYLLPAFQKEKLPADKKANNQLQQQLKTLSLPAAAKEAPAVSTILKEKKYTLNENEAQLKSVSLKLDKNIYAITFETNTGSHTMHFAQRVWVTDSTNMPGPSLVAAAFEKRDFLYPAKIAGTYSWLDNQTLQFVLRYIESPHSLKYTFHLNEKKLTLDVESSIDFGKKKVIIEGMEK